MDKTCFSKLIVRISQFFQSTKLPSSSHVDLWFEQIKQIPEESIDFIEKQIYKDRDSLPRNIPKAIKEAYDNYPKVNKFFKYDPVEDYRFPVSKMHEGLNILQTNGYDSFFAFCKICQMPENDQDRVITKHKIINGEIVIDIERIKRKIGTTMPKKSMDIQKRIGLLKHQAETILREPGWEDEQIPF